MNIRPIICAAATAILLYLSGCADESYISINDSDSSGSSNSVSIAENNLLLAKKPIATPQNAVRLYISADGDGERIRLTLAQVQEISDSICENIDTDYDKLYALAEYVAENYYYDNDAKANGVTDETICIAHTLETKRTVCMGYANLFAALCQAQGLECYIAHGGAVVTGTFESNNDVRLHEWNVAVLDGKIIWIDTLWNTTNSYRDGKYNYGSVDADYFDLDNDTLAQNHRADRIEKRDYFSVLAD